MTMRSTPKQHIPHCFIEKMEIDALVRQPVVPIGIVKPLRQARRNCQVYFLGPAGGGPLGGGSPVALAA